MSDQQAVGTQTALEADIEAQRERLAETVDALAHKVDVKAQAKERAADLKDRATTDNGRPQPFVVMAGAGALLAVGLLVWWRRR